jgi:hypothetical protein
MKKRIILIVAGLFLMVAAASALESDYYYVNVPIEKIYAHELGYMVVYRVGTATIANCYLPMEWFYTRTGKGDLDYGYGSMFPYMSIYYYQGKFSHVRLHLNFDKNDSRWGVFAQGADVKAKFQGVEEVKLQY